MQNRTQQRIVNLDVSIVIDETIRGLVHTAKTKRPPEGGL